jgi:putative ABC transport system ATP-binding protein
MAEAKKKQEKKSTETSENDSFKILLQDIEELKQGETLIKCSNIIKTYDEKTINVKALQGIDLTIKKGEFIAIVGASGSGKTTLLNLIGGLDSPTDGSIYFYGHDISDLNEEERTYYRRQIGFIFQNFNLHPVLTAEQNIELALVYNNIPKAKRLTKTLQLLQYVGLEERADHIPAELSSGEKQRIGIARALANNPKIILADQPTGNLDSFTGEKIIDLMIELKEKLNLTVVLVTHNIDIALKSDRILEIKDGKIRPYKLSKD